MAPRGVGQVLLDPLDRLQQALGRRVRSDVVRRVVRQLLRETVNGYCPEGEAVPVDLRPVDWLRGLAMLSGIPANQTRTLAETTLERVKLPSEAWGKRLGQYSKGMKQRVKLPSLTL